MPSVKSIITLRISAPTRRSGLRDPEIGIPTYKGRGAYPQKQRPLTDPVPVSEIANDPSLSWQTVSIGEGAKGPIIAQVTRLREVEQRDGLPGKEYWLFLRRYADSEIKYALCNAPQDMTMEEMVRASTMRWSIEQLFQEGKSYLDMDDYEVRSYTGWHRHMTLVFLIMHFLLSVRIEFGEKNLLTLPQAKRLLVAALAEESLTLKKAIAMAYFITTSAEMKLLAYLTGRESWQCCKKHSVKKDLKTWLLQINVCYLRLV